MCKISVVTSVYNAEEFIAETIESVIKQTYTDWEYIIINDCSKDKSDSIIRQYADMDPRIKYVNNEYNEGQCANLNKGIRMSKGKYIARLDHDDICMPDRFEKQFDYMEKHPDTVLLGSRMMELKNGRIRKSNVEANISSYEELMFYSLFYQPMAHSTFFIRKSVMYDSNIWYGEFAFAEDYALVCDMVSAGKVMRLAEPLVIYRFSKRQTTKMTDISVRYDEGKSIRDKYVQSIGYEPTEIIQDAMDGRIRGYRRTRDFERGLLEFASFCGVDIINEQRIPDCVKDAFWMTLIRQTGGMGIFFAYLQSPLRHRKKMVNRADLRVFIKGLTGR